MTTLSLNVPNFGPLLGGDRYGRLLSVCEAADEAGFDRLLLTDHVVMGADTSGYTWSAFPTEPDANWLEPLTTLAVLAGRTRRIRLGTGIVIAALRGGAVLAKTAATLDLLSSGRLDLGVGTGWQAKEYEAVGLDFRARGRLLDDTLQVCRALWSGAPASVDTPSVAFTGVYSAPRPEGAIPIWVSGSLSKAVVRRTVRFGDGWIPIMGATDDDLAAGTRVMRDAFAEAGRDPDDLAVRGRLTVAKTGDGAVDGARTMEHAAALIEAGATDLMVPLQAIDADPQRAVEQFPALVAAFRDEIGAPAR
ncbi:TIGR03619 family F420-dependent LLM class oxidoreductase [Rhodococcus triatomae]|uniref:Probable F420-dependent oxidoreductase, Rv2161c family n=1 Tax=Rhodococcus triatomae TaxID=300028 RepID=A0A1G7ZUH8_9NOCA|nr:TIGR03619 family F420-dependent LLM class oxidoreductase [Rhodococcus triatomae]QNG17943.1 TIGR03619 family F420-dependent LLM class oxidoreductase [Rhodococcus triatomae]QNG22388.1 TIGR03619 family F420-dependent LLM class oxidoreductase [Rhodococcus triatomae]SDH12339.1 probable F420-dependent oxidoreductase, Rv2161c family [Rhodococcus triatomae]